ncbi:unnamed protein product, partial [Durusdinium trenchii]
AAIWPLCHEFLCYSLLEVLIAWPRRFQNASMILLLAVCFQRHRSASAMNWQRGHRMLDINRVPLCLEAALLTRGMEALLNSRVWTTGLLGFRGVLGWAFYLLGAFVTGILEWCLIDGPIVAVPLWIFPLHSKLPLLLGTVFLLEHSFLSAETEKQETAQEAKLSDILSQYLLTFMLVHVYMLPSRTDRMVPGAAVLLEQLWFLLGVCALPTFLVHLAQQPFQKFFLSAVDVVSRHSVWSSLLPLVAILAVGTAMLLACTEWECIS